MKVKMLAVSIALLVSGVAHATTDNPWYAGARLGISHVSDLGGSLEPEGSNPAGGFFMGYQSTPWLALEAGYTYLGETDVKGFPGSYQAQGFDVVGKFSYAAAEDVDLFLKAGSYIYDWSAKGPLQGDDSGLSATLGAGVEYFINNNWSTRLEYQYYDNVGGATIHFTGLSFAYHWGAPEPIVIIEPEPVPEPEPIVVPEPVMVEVETVKIITLDEVKVLVPFAFDGTALTKEERASLAPIAQRLQENNMAVVVVVGHADSRGAKAYNQTLSEKRAQVVAESLSKTLNLDMNRIVVEGRGESDPIASNATEEGRAQNRRVEIISPAMDIEEITTEWVEQLQVPEQAEDATQQATPDATTEAQD
ncbi:OmpA family protein [Photobacterium japonica]|uniref:OmpA family protein n=1 Tax=Photobacterium japonica TaxID=2910235 RepID=UPI003D0F50C6